MKHVYLVALISGFLTASDSQNNFGHITLQDLLQEQVRCDEEFKKISSIVLSQWPSFKKSYLKRNHLDFETRVMDIFCQMSLIQSIITRTSLTIYHGSTHPEKNRIIQELNMMRRKIDKDKKMRSYVSLRLSYLLKKNLLKFINNNYHK